MSTKNKKREITNNFHAIAAAYILDEKCNISFQGNKEKVDAVTNVLQASKRLYQELNKSNASLPKISKLLEAKNIASIHFKQVTGINWLL